MRYVYTDTTRPPARARSRERERERESTHGYTSNLDLFSLSFSFSPLSHSLSLTLSVSISFLRRREGGERNDKRNGSTAEKRVNVGERECVCRLLTGHLAYTHTRETRRALDSVRR